MTAQIGSISSGMMRPEDLIPCFIDELTRQIDDMSLSLGVGATADQTQACKAEYARITDLLAKIESRMFDEDGETIEAYFESEDAQYDLESLFDELQAFAPDYCTFGSHPGDGADYGFWIDFDALESAVQDCEILKVADLSDIPREYAGIVLHVNDHGNCTLYHVEDDGGTCTELWSIV